MSERDRTDHSDRTAGVATPPAAVTSEAVITEPAQQAALAGNKSDTGSYNLQQFELVDAKPGQGAEREGPQFKPPYYNLRFDYTEDPLQKGVGKLSLDFDNVTEKMSKLLGKPEINDKHRFSLQNLKDAIEHPELAKTFSDVEQQSLRLMANQARRLVDKEMLPKFDPKMMQSGKLPFDEFFISKKSVNNAGKQLGVIKEA